MKKFSKFMAEAGQPEIPNEPTYGRNPSQGYLTTEVVKKLNAIVGRIFEGDQFDPEAKLTLTRSSLSKIGLTFDPYPNMTESNGSFSLPLTLFGGRFGKAGGGIIQSTIFLLIPSYTFAEATHQNSAMTYTEFCSYLDMDENDSTSENLWHFFDNDDSGAIEFSEFVRGVALLSNDVDDVDRLKLAFALLDHDKQGKVSIIDIRKFLADADRLEVVKKHMNEKNEKKKGSMHSKNVAAVVIVEEATAEEKSTRSSSIDTAEGKNSNSDVETGEDRGSWQSKGSIENRDGEPSLVRQSSLLDCFASVDEDGDGLVSFDEFVTIAHRRGTLAGPLLQVAKNLIAPMDGIKEDEQEKKSTRC